MRLVPLVLLTSLVLLASGSPGVTPRRSAADYPTRAANADATIGAAIIPPGEAKKIFGADLSDYVVLEVGFFPAQGRTAEISPSDFTLVTDADSISERPADSDAVAAVVFKDADRASTRKPPVYVTTGIDVEHASYPDPLTGRQRGVTAVGTGAGVGVGGPDIHPLPPAYGTGSRHQLEQQLWEKSLPDGHISRDSAGYLYFPKPSKKAKNAAWILRWDGPNGRVNVALSNQAKH